MAHITISTDPVRETKTVTTAADTFTFSFEFFEADGADIKVYNFVADPDTVVSPTIYTITPNLGTDGGYNGGTLELDTAVTSTSIIIMLDMDFTRTTDFPDKGNFNIASLNTQLDKNVNLIKQIGVRVDRAFRLKDSDTATYPLTLPSTGVSSTRAFLMIDSTDGLTYNAAASLGAVVAATATPLAGAITGVVGTDTDYAREDHVHPLTYVKGGDIASATNTTIDTDGRYFDVTGTTTITDMTVAVNREFTLQFDGALVLTHNTSKIDLPSEANITTAAGDVATFFAHTANQVQCTSFTRANGKAIAKIAVSDLANGTDGQLITWAADATPATVAVGTATHVLTSNGAGAAPTFQSSSSISQATQGAIEAETNENTYIPPDLINFNPGVVKGWVAYNHSGPAVLASRNVTSVADNSTGDFTVTWATDFSSTSYAAFVDATNATYTWGIVHTIAAGTTRCLTGQHSDNSLTDTANSMVLAVGDQ
jgi:hypothetical protein